MKSKIKHIAVSSLALLLVALPVYADLVSCGDNAGNVCKFADLISMVYKVVNYMIAMAGLVAVFYIVVGGVTMVLSSGDPGRVKTAKDTIRNAIMGLVLVMLSYMIVGYVASLFLPNIGGDPLQTLKTYLPWN